MDRGVQQEADTVITNASCGESVALHGDGAWSAVPPPQNKHQAAPPWGPSRSWDGLANDLRGRLSGGFPGRYTGLLRGVSLCPGHDVGVTAWHTA